MSDEPQPEMSPPEPVPQDTTSSELVDVLPVAPETPREPESAVPVNIDNEQIRQSEGQNPAPEPTAQIEEVEENKPVSEPPTQPTAQIPVIEPFTKLSLLGKAREAIQFRKRKKLEKIIGMFLKQSSITNDDVEKLLHVSDATATRYLEQLEKDGRVRQNGRTGKSTHYEKK